MIADLLALKANLATLHTMQGLSCGEHLKYCQWFGSDGHWIAQVQYDNQAVNGGLLSYR